MALSGFCCGVLCCQGSQSLQRNIARIAGNLLANFSIRFIFRYPSSFSFAMVFGISAKLIVGFMRVGCAQNPDMFLTNITAEDSRLGGKALSQITLVYTVQEAQHAVVQDQENDLKIPWFVLRTPQSLPDGWLVQPVGCNYSRCSETRPVLEIAPDESELPRLWPLGLC